MERTKTKRIPVAVAEFAAPQNTKPAPENDATGDWLHCSQTVGYLADALDDIRKAIPGLALAVRRAIGAKAFTVDDTVRVDDLDHSPRDHAALDGPPVVLAGVRLIAGAA